MTIAGVHLRGLVRPPLLLLAAALAVGAGCSASTTRVLPPEQTPLPALTASRAELIEELEARSEAIDTVSARVNYTLSVVREGAAAGILEEYRETSGALVAERPSHIRMQGQLPLALATAFDMVSDGETFRLSVPPRNRFIIGRNDIPPEDAAAGGNTALQLRPQHVMDGLFVDVRSHLDRVTVVAPLEQVLEGRRSYYVFSFIETGDEVPRLLEKVWIDRLDLRVARKQQFGGEGDVETDVTYTRYEEADGIEFPREVVIQRPQENYSLRITFDNVVLNRPLGENVFVLAAPPGAVLVRLSGSAVEGSE